MDSLIKEIEILPFNVPLKEPFQIALGEYQDSKNVLVKVYLDNGLIGIGEGSECGFVTGDIQETMLPALNYLKPLFIKTKISKWRENMRAAKKLLTGHFSAFWALETALLDAYTKNLGLPLYQYLGGSRETIETDITIPIVSPEHAYELAELNSKQGFDCFKIKVGHDLAEDFARVRSVAQAVPDCRLRIDANQGYTPKQAEQFIQTMYNEGLNIELFEQPVKKHDLLGLRYVREHSPVPVAADEAVFNAQDLLAVIRLQATDIVNIKLAKSSGIVEALDMIALAKQSGMKLMIGCMLESNIGLAASVHLACGTGEFSYLDLDSHLLLAELPLAGGFQTQGKALSVFSDRFGLGIVL